MAGSGAAISHCCCLPLIVNDLSFLGTLHSNIAVIAGNFSQNDGVAHGCVQGDRRVGLQKRRMTFFHGAHFSVPTMMPISAAPGQCGEAIAAGSALSHAPSLYFVLRGTNGIAE
jgi:hypothetical protein